MKPSVFYLDDQKVNTLVFKRLLSDYYHITTFNSFSELEKTISVTGPDIFLLDILMPDINGIDVARIIRNTERFRLTPILILTALDNVDDLVKCFKAGVNDFLVKPPDYKELRARIDALILSSTRQQEYARDRRFDSLKLMIQGFNHEFNNHLTILQSGVEILKMVLEDKGFDEGKRVEAILHTISRSADLLRELSAITTFSRERFDYHSLRALVDDLLGYAKSYMSFCGVEFNCIDNTEGDGFIRLSPWIFRKLFEALFSNATDAFHGLEGRQKTVTLTLETRDCFLYAFVEDNGCGISPACQARIFDPFFTTKGSFGGRVVGSKVNGTGLGLTYVESIVRESGGMVKISSVEGEGTQVVLSLPLLYQHDGLHSLADPRFEIPRKRDKLLVALLGCASADSFVLYKYLSVQGLDTMLLASKKGLLNSDYDAVIFSSCFELDELRAMVEDLQKDKGELFPVFITLKADAELHDYIGFQAMNCCLLKEPLDYGRLMRYLNSISFV